MLINVNDSDLSKEYVVGFWHYKTDNFTIFHSFDNEKTAERVARKLKNKKVYNGVPVQYAICVEYMHFLKRFK